VIYVVARRALVLSDEATSCDWEAALAKYKSASQRHISSSKYNNRMTKILYRAHAVQRMFEREISPVKVRKALEAEDVIEDYSSEMPEPSRLIMGFQGKRPFHVVTSENPAANEITVVTVYLPDSNKWKKDFRSRK
jgi:hypothetical protein